MLKRSRYYVSPGTQGNVCKAFRCSRWSSKVTSDERKNKEIDARIGKEDAVLRELYRSVFTKQELSNTAKLSAFKSVFVPIITYGHESWVMTEEHCTKYKRQRSDFCEEFTPWRFATKCAVVNFVKTWMSNHFYSEWRDPNYVGSAVRPKIIEGSPAVSTHGKAAQRSSKEVTTPPIIA